MIAAAPIAARMFAAVPPPPGMGTRVFARAENAEPSPEPSPAAVAAPDGPGPAAAPSAATAARARAEFDANRAGKIDRTHYTAAMNGAISDAALRRVATTLSALGAVKTFAQVRRISQGAFVVYVFRVELERSPAVEETIAWNAAGKVEYLHFGVVE